jgi:hypothetical protein
VKRHLFNLASSASLLLCVATVVLWVRGYWKGDCVTWNDWLHKLDYEVYSARGIVAVQVSDDDFWQDPFGHDSFNPAVDDGWRHVIESPRQYP